MLHNSTWRYAAAILVITVSLEVVGLEELSATNDDLNVVMTDDFDNGTDLWTYTDRSDGSMEWDPADGSPDSGSLKLSNSYPLSQSHGFFAVGRCMKADPGELWRIELVRKKTGNGLGDCTAFVRFFSGPDCSGEGTIIGNTPYLEPDVWELHTLGFTTFSTTRSVRAALLMSVTASAGVMTCHYDSVTVYTDRAPTVTDIPTLSLAGHLVIASLLALVGSVLLARRSSHKVRGTYRVADTV